MPQASELDECLSNFRYDFKTLQSDFDKLKSCSRRAEYDLFLRLSQRDVLSTTEIQTLLQLNVEGTFSLGGASIYKTRIKPTLEKLFETTPTPQEEALAKKLNAFYRLHGSPLEDIKNNRLSGSAAQSYLEPFIQAAITLARNNGNDTSPKSKAWWSEYQTDMAALRKMLVSNPPDATFQQLHKAVNTLFDTWFINKAGPVEEAHKHYEDAEIIETLEAAKQSVQSLGRQR